MSLDDKYNFGSNEVADAIWTLESVVEDMELRYEEVESENRDGINDEENYIFGSYDKESLIDSYLGAKIYFNEWKDSKVNMDEDDEKIVNWYHQTVGFSRYLFAALDSKYDKNIWSEIERIEEKLKANGIKFEEDNSDFESYRSYWEIFKNSSDEGFSPEFNFNVEEDENGEKWGVGSN